MITQDLAQAGALAVAEARRLFALDVTNSDHGHSQTVISGILKTCGWTWPEVYPYRGNVAYCTMTAGACWTAAGLDPKWLAAFFASTERLDAWAHYRPWNEHANPAPATGGRRLVVELDEHSTPRDLPFVPQPGDIVTIGDGSIREGNHGLVAESYDASRGVFSCISGNGVGIGPDGRRRFGIVRSEVRIGGAGYCVRRVIRPALGDLVRP